METRKPSHEEWRKIAKKFQRKRRRRLIAMKRDEEMKYSTFQSELIAEQCLKRELDRINHLNEIEHDKWIESERRIEKIWKKQQCKLEEQAKKLEEERRRIQEEFEAEQKRIADAAEEKRRVIWEQQQRQIDLENRIQAFIEGVGGVPSELMVEAETNPNKVLCTFFERTASCRFGHKCIKNHKRQKLSKILVMPAFFNNIHFEQSRETEYGSDITLEHDEIELYENFKEFFDDVIPEFEQFGHIEHFVVCNNYEPHLRGHVFVEYTSERNALKAQRIMHGRYYAGRMLNVEFCKLAWKTAVCGASMKNTCRKGRECSFLHIFKNPRDQYSVNRTLSEPSSTYLTNNHRNGSIRTEDKDNFDYNGEQTKTNWRWSESPIKEIIEKNVRRTQTETQMRHRGRSRSRSRSPLRRSTKRSRSRCSSHSKKKKSRRSSRSSERTKRHRR